MPYVLVVVESHNSPQKTIDKIVGCKAIKFYCKWDLSTKNALGMRKKLYHRSCLHNLAVYEWGCCFCDSWE